MREIRFPVHMPISSPSYVKVSDINDICKNAFPENWNSLMLEFHELMLSSTRVIEGIYPHDVLACFLRIASRRKLVLNVSFYDYETLQELEINPYHSGIL